MKDLAQSILENTTPPVVGRDGRIPVIIAMAAKKSHLEHRPVKLSEVKQPTFERA